MGAMKVWDGSAWQTVAPFSERASCFVGPDPPAGVAYAGDLWWDTDDPTIAYPGAELTYTQITTGVTVAVNTEATAQQVISSGTQTYDGSAILLEFFAARVEPAQNGQILLLLWDGGTNLGWWSQMFGEVSGVPTNGFVGPVCLRRRLVPTVGSHTYRVMAWALTGTGYVYAGSGATGVHVPTYIRVTRV